MCLCCNQGPSPPHCRSSYCAHQAAQVIATPWGQALKSYHTQLLEPFTAHKASHLHKSSRLACKAGRDGARRGGPGRASLRSTCPADAQLAANQASPAPPALGLIATHNCPSPPPACRSAALQTLAIASWRGSRPPAAAWQPPAASRGAASKKPCSASGRVQVWRGVGCGGAALADQRGAPRQGLGGLGRLPDPLVPWPAQQRRVPLALDAWCCAGRAPPPFSPAPPPLPQSTGTPGTRCSGWTPTTAPRCGSGRSS